MTLANPGPGDQIVVGPIDLAAVRHERHRRRGHHMLAHLRNETYASYRQPIYPAGSAIDGLSLGKNEDAIQQGRQSLDVLARSLGHNGPDHQQ